MSVCQKFNFDSSHKIIDLSDDTKNLDNLVIRDYSTTNSSMFSPFIINLAPAEET